VFTILAFKISAFAAATGAPIAQIQAPLHAAPFGADSSVRAIDRSAAEHAFALYDSSALATVTAQAIDPAQQATPSAPEREVFIPSPGAIALFGVGALAMRRGRKR